MTDTTFGDRRAAAVAARARAMAAASDRFEVLDSWRGICALLVALHHFPASGALSQSTFVAGCYLFVDFFFVLSGFVIAGAYAERLSTPLDVKRFALVRFGRLYPLHLVMLLAFAAFEVLRLLLPQLRGAGEPPFTGGFSVGSFFTNLFLIQGLGVEDRLTWNQPSWSISTEFFAYLVFAAAVFLLGRRAWIWFLAAVVVGPLFIWTLSTNHMNVTVDYGFIRCLYGFALGALLATFARASILAARLYGEARVLPWTLAEIGMVVAIGVFVSFASDSDLGILAPFLFAIALYVFAHEAGFVSRLLRSGPMLTLGALSYSIYMVHPFIQLRLINVASLVDRKLGLGLLGELSFHGDTTVGFGPDQPLLGTLAVAGMLVAVLIASWLTWRFIEMPGLAWFRRRARALT